MSAWQSRLDAKDKEKQALIDDLKAVANKPTKQNLEAVFKRYQKLIRRLSKAGGQIDAARAALAELDALVASLLGRNG